MPLLHVVTHREDHWKSQLSAPLRPWRGIPAETSGNAAHNPPLTWALGINAIGDRLDGDIRAQRRQPGRYRGVAAVDRVARRADRLPVGGEAGQDERDS